MRLLLHCGVAWRTPLTPRAQPRPRLVCAVTEAVTGLHGAVTTVVIAHRLSTVLHSSLVLYLEGGSLVSSSTFAEVRAAVPGLERQAKLPGL